ncbi:MAG TPA: ABC transporter substrate-binding protein [Stellaceae bacterium]|jgi:NitT/TauT family transport system substrate-binding protein|nr:ABC transporter substrate-binding protein [Stellaceae bacterium]
MRTQRLAASLLALWLSAPIAGATEKFEAGLLGSPNSAGWIWYIAQEEGFFAKANLEPDIIYVPTPSGLMQQLAAGSLDTVEIGVVEPIHAIARGAPVAIARIMGAVPPYEMVANVKTVKELKGKTVVIGGLLDINRVYLNRIMLGNGLHDGDYDITTVGNTPGRFAALKSGSADATMVAAPFNFYAENAGFHNVGLILDYAHDLPFGSTDVTLAYAKDNRDALLRLLDVLEESSVWFNDTNNRNTAIDVLLKVMKSDQRDDVAKSYDYMRRIGYFEPKGVVSRKSIATVEKEMTAIGDSAENVPFEKLVLPGVTKVGD